MKFGWTLLPVVVLLLCLHLAGGQVEQAGAPVERIVLTTIFGKVCKAWKGRDIAKRARQHD